MYGSGVHHYQPESMCASMNLKHLSSLCAKKLQWKLLAGKVMLIVYEIMLTNFQRNGDNVCAKSYREVPLMLWGVIVD